MKIITIYTKEATFRFTNVSPLTYKQLPKTEIEEINSYDPLSAFIVDGMHFKFNYDSQSQNKKVIIKDKENKDVQVDLPIRQFACFMKDSICGISITDDQGVEYAEKQEQIKTTN